MQLISTFVFAKKDSTVATFPVLPKSKISRPYASSVAVQPGFVSDLVVNPKDSLSHDAAQMISAVASTAAASFP